MRWLRGTPFFFFSSKRGSQDLSIGTKVFPLTGPGNVLSLCPSVLLILCYFFFIPSAYLLGECGRPAVGWTTVRSRRSASVTWGLTRRRGTVTSRTKMWVKKRFPPLFLWTRSFKHGPCVRKWMKFLQIRWWSWCQVNELANLDSLFKKKEICIVNVWYRRWLWRYNWRCCKNFESQL